MNLRQIIRKEVRSVMDGIPDKQEVKKLRKEMQKISSDFSKFKTSKGNQDYQDEFNLWDAARKADSFLDKAATALGNEWFLRNQGMREAAEAEMVKAEKNYKKGIRFYKKAKLLKPMANKNKV